MKFTIKTTKSKALQNSLVILLFILTLQTTYSQNYAGGDGSESNPYQISTWHHLDNVELNLTSHFILMNDLSTETSGYSENASPSANLNNGWFPLPDFSGKFNGNNHSITGLTINRTTNDASLFKSITNSGKVENLILTNVNIKGAERVGAITAQNFGLIENCHVSGTVESSTSTDFNNVGGIAGRNAINNGVGVIKNSSSSATIIGNKQHVGGISGVTRDGARIESCYSTGDITAAWGRVGGISGGLGTSSEIKESYATGTITSNGNLPAGGLVGNFNGSIYNSYATGKVVSNNNIAGGLVGNGGASTLIFNSYATGEVSGNSIGGFIGELNENAVNNAISNSFWDVEASGVGNEEDSNFNAVGKLTSDLKAITTFTNANWDFEDVWEIKEQTSGFVSYPYLKSITYDEINSETNNNPIPGLIGVDFAGGDGSENNPYQISTWHHLDNVRLNLTDHFILTTDLDSETSGYNEFASATANTTNGWQPIGELEAMFTGSFNGNNKHIKDLYIERSTQNQIGLFGYTNAAEIHHLNLLDVAVTGGENTGGLIGLSKNTKVEQVQVTGTITGTLQTGGVIGFQQGDESILKISKFNGAVEGENAVGGLVGTNYGAIETSMANANVSGDFLVGGLVGLNQKITEVDLVLAIQGMGTVSRAPNLETYEKNSEVVLTANPNTNWGFVNWSGDVSGTDNPLNLTMNSDKNITANFTQVAFVVNLNSYGSSGGTTEIIAELGQAMPSATPPNSSAFKGYYSEPNGEGTQYYDENMNSVQNWDINEDTELFAYLNFCEGSPCQNNGTCINDPELLTFICECPDEYVGDRCQHINACFLIAEENHCGEFGVCENDGGGIRCVCNPGQACACCNGLDVIGFPCTVQGLANTGEYCLTPQAVEAILDLTFSPTNNNNNNSFKQTRLAIQKLKKSKNDFAAIGIKLN